MAYVHVRRTCEAGESCPSLIFDTDTGDALVGGPRDDAAAAEMGLPPHEGVTRIPARDIRNLLYGIGPDTFPGPVTS